MSDSATRDAPHTDGQVLDAIRGTYREDTTAAIPSWGYDSARTVGAT